MCTYCGCGFFLLMCVQLYKQNSYRDQRVCQRLIWVTLLCIESPVCPFDTSDMSNITLYTVLCKSHNHQFWHLWHTSHLIIYWYYSTVFHTFDTSDMPFDLLFIVQYLAPSTPLTSKSHSIYNVDSNTKSSNYMKIQFKTFIYFELQESLK